MQGRRPAQARNNLPRLTGRMNPQQSLRKVGPAISEVLRTSVRPRNRAGVPTNTNQKQPQKFRPSSGADAILCLDEETGVDDVAAEREQDSRVEAKGGVVPSKSMTETPLPTKVVLPKFVRPVDKQGVSKRYGVVSPETNLSIPRTPAPTRKDTAKVQPPGLLINRQPNYARNRRVSKALPSLPPPSPSPCRASFPPPPKPSKDVFDTNKGKVLRGQGSPIIPSPTIAPKMSENCDSSSGSSYDSAEQTWNMINGLMNAVNEDEVKRARESIIRMSGVGLPSPQRKSREVQVGRFGGGEGNGLVKFPCKDEGEDDVKEGEEWNSEGDSSSDRTYRTSSTGSTASSLTLHSSNPPLSSEDWKGSITDSVTINKEQLQQQHNFPDTFPRTRKRGVSRTASVYSVVIKPTRERSNETQDALILEDDLPTRIRGIIQCNHGSYEPGLCSRSISEDGEGVGLHPDLMLTIDTLRTVEVEDITFT